MATAFKMVKTFFNGLHRLDTITIQFVCHGLPGNSGDKGCSAFQDVLCHNSTQQPLYSSIRLLPASGGLAYRLPFAIFRPLLLISDFLLMVILV